MMLCSLNKGYIIYVTGILQEYPSLAVDISLPSHYNGIVVIEFIKEKPRRRQYPFPNITESRCRWESGISRREEKITPELPAEGLSRPGRISCVKGTHMMVCSNRWLNESKLSSFYGDGSFFFFMVMHRQVTDPCIENSGR